MATLKCKMCGGDLAFEAEVTVCECEYCGTKQTVPTADSEKKMNLFARANRLRANNEFDKAIGIYESIVAEFPEEAEAYWGLILCKYGIEYVDDPADGRKVPTCHRSSFDSIMEDSDFEMVMEYADPIAKRVYREEAKQLEEIRKRIIEVSDKEEPYDIFICYKETAEDGQRTLDSVLAQDVYDALTEKGYRVFFSRISLEDKLGVEYEPYIFAALNSAKIMLVFGTDYDYYNAVWVKNEWSRFLMLMAKVKSKHLIPCYKDIDAYDIPKEFAKLQAQDMGKVGAIQDLLRGIDKITGRGEKKTSEESEKIASVQTIVAGGPSTASLIDRGNMALEDGEFDEAKDFFNRALDIDSKSAEAYLGLFMVGIKVESRFMAGECFEIEDYSENSNWKRVKKFASGDLKTLVDEWEQKRADFIHEEEENRREKKERQKRIEEGWIYFKEEIIEQKKKILEEELTRESEKLEQAKKEELERLTTLQEEQEKKISALQQEIENLNQTIRNLESRITERRNYLGTLGIFKGKEKKEVQESIERLNLEKEKVEKEKNSIEIQKSNEQESLDTMMGQNSRCIVDEESGKKVELEEKKSILENFLDSSSDVIKFGINPDDGKTIEWIVMENCEKGILLLSKYAVNTMPYNKDFEDITWENCSLRKWLNNGFFQKAFSKEEQNLVKMIDVKNDDNPLYKTDGGNDTKDKVFLISIDEVDEYFSSDEGRKATLADGTSVCWWLRSPGADSKFAAAVVFDGSVFENGGPVSDGSAGVRPALWMDVTNL